MTIAEMLRAEGRKEAGKKNFEEGERKGERKVALKMMDEGLPLELVVSCTSFSAEQLEAFRQERDQEANSVSNKQ